MKICGNFTRGFCKEAAVPLQAMPIGVVTRTGPVAPAFKAHDCCFLSGMGPVQVHIRPVGMLFCRAVYTQIESLHYHADEAEVRLDQAQEQLQDFADRAPDQIADAAQQASPITKCKWYHGHADLMPGLCLCAVWACCILAVALSSVWLQAQDAKALHPQKAFDSLLHS